MREGNRLTCLHKGGACLKMLQILGMRSLAELGFESKGLWRTANTTRALSIRSGPPLLRHACPALATSRAREANTYSRTADFQ